jgi:hypothetical protein
MYIKNDTLIKLIAVFAVLAIGITMLISLTSCNPSGEYTYGRLSYQTDSVELLPILVKIDGTAVDSIIKIGYWDCQNTDEYILLPTFQSHEVTMFNSVNQMILKQDVVIEENECKLIEI